MYNNAYQVHDLASRLDDDEESEVRDKRVPRSRLNSDPCLPSRLPGSGAGSSSVHLFPLTHLEGFLQREGDILAPRAVLRQLRRTPSPPLFPADEGPVGEPSSIARRASTSSDVSSTKSPTSPSSGKKLKLSTGWSEPQSFEIFRAIERKDVVFLMQVRDNAFHLLLQKSGGATPLVHAMRIGESHRDITIVLLGAMSRWVNQLEDSDMSDKKTKPLLKALRTNLKLAIDYGLQSSHTDLVASFLQTLIMSEGDRWVNSQTNSIAIVLRAGSDGKPVRTAEKAVRAFATKELGKADAIAALEDYVANATIDLLLMGAWCCALESIAGTPIPTYYFARDDRVFKAFQARIHANRSFISRTLSKRLKWQIRLLETVLDGRNTTLRSKVEVLAGELDEGPGV